MLRRVSLSVFAALAVSLPASALELDRIEVKSGIGQPLRAEFPVVFAAPSELRKLRAQLAAPATVARIVLDRPPGLVVRPHFRLIMRPAAKGCVNKIRHRS